MNGLESKKVSSSVSKISKPLDLLKASTDDIKNLISEFIKENSKIIAYLDYKVLIGYYKNGQFEFYNGEQIEPKYIQKMRVFNENEELHLWRSDCLLYGRYRKDCAGNDCYVVDAKQALFGTKFSQISAGVFLKLTEDRGTELIIPAENLKLMPDGDAHYFIKTRNYVEYLCDGTQASYSDCRFIDFVN